MLAGRAKQSLGREHEPLSALVAAAGRGPGGVFGRRPDGRTELVLPPVAFLRRLCGIIPPPRRHLVRHAGVFGPATKVHAKLPALVPSRGGGPPPAAASPSGSMRASRVPWAELLRRVFATDVLSCPCGGRRSVVAVVVDSARARTVLAALGLPCTPATLRACAGPTAGRVLVR